MDELVRAYQRLMWGLVDLSEIMGEESPGFGYAERLAQESKQLYVQLVTAVSDQLNLDTPANESNQGREA